MNCYWYAVTMNFIITVIICIAMVVSQTLWPLLGLILFAHIDEDECACNKEKK